MKQLLAQQEILHPNIFHSLKKAMKPLLKMQIDEHNNNEERKAKKENKRQKAEESAKRKKLEAEKASGYVLLYWGVRMLIPIFNAP